MMREASLRHSSFLFRYSIFFFFSWFLSYGDSRFVVAADWPQLLGPRRNGISRETGLLTSWPEKGPPKLWDKSIGDGYSGPVVVADKLILFHRIGNEEMVECLDANTGNGLWKRGYETDYVDKYGKGNGPRSTPLISGDRVYTLGVDGVLLALELQSELEFQRFETLTEIVMECIHRGRALRVLSVGRKRWHIGPTPGHEAVEILAVAHNNERVRRCQSWYGNIAPRS